MVDFKAQTDCYFQKFNLNAFKDLNFPMLKTYLKLDNEMIDSKNLLNLNSFQSEKLLSQNLIFIKDI